MGIIEFFTNRGTDTTEDVKAPAFSLTKVQAGLGTLVAAAAAALAKTEGDDTIKVAALAAGTVVLLGVFALAAVDLVTRQRAAEATLRFEKAKPADSDFVALPESQTLVLQEDNSQDEYDLRLAQVKEGKIHLVATRDGKTITETFQEQPDAS